MVFDPTCHNRRSIRLPGHQYSDNGAYYITIRTFGRSHSLGRIEGTSISRSAEGIIADERWRAIPGHHPGVSIDAWVVMPDHVHGILIIDREEPASPIEPDAVSDDSPRGPAAGSVGAIVGSFKAGVTRRINLLRSTPDATFWQRNYYEHVVRSEADLERIRRYIAENPARWGRRRGTGLDTLLG